MTSNSQPATGTPPVLQGAFPAGSPVHNLRDFGGYATATGARLKPGRLLRSGQLEAAGAGFEGILSALGVATIIDLRAGSECTLERGGAFDGYAGAIRRATAHDETIPHAVAAFLKMTTIEEVVAHMTRIYRILPDSPRFRESMGHLVTALDQDDGATLIHCFAGKDRTGLAVALVQIALGVHRDDVFHDYLLTNAMGPERIESGLDALLGKDRARGSQWVLEEAMSVRPEYLEAGLAKIGEISASPAAYLEAMAGLPSGAMDRIGQRLQA
ncbi:MULTISPECIES: tyrosine-protein phosphatase [Novosphingobium]|uniref:tyrosine-protein phosphatase n=1 Tax=Novosphingobium TaxID=165696 RepID=UPI0022F28C7B|nr:tyrosine-protein phosphatase [Novosphingobium resinovorum]GLK42942.1 protein-tyrosine-phosphatase [Novosphingobium resinovorum]